MLTQQINCRKPLRFENLDPESAPTTQLKSTSTTNNYPSIVSLAQNVTAATMMLKYYSLVCACPFNLPVQSLVKLLALAATRDNVEDAQAKEYIAEANQAVAAY